MTNLESIESSQTTPTSQHGEKDISKIPPLSLQIITDEDEMIAALRLVADSIAEQRQVAASAIIFHPVCVTMLLTVYTAVFGRDYFRRDLGTLVLVSSGILMTYFLAARYIAGSFIHLAENFKWRSWLAGPNGMDTVITAKFGNEVIGTAVVRLDPDADRDERGNRRGRGIIRAWTVKMRYRRRGVGTDLLSTAIRVVKSRYGSDSVVQLAKDHANSDIPIPNIFSGPFRTQQAKAAVILERLLSASKVVQAPTHLKNTQDTRKP